MLSTFKDLYDDEFGVIISAELILVLTIAVLAMVVGLTALRDAVSQELNDLSHAFGALSQTYNVTGMIKNKDRGKPHAWISGFGYNDAIDECDCKPIRLITVCGKDDPSDGERE